MTLSNIIYESGRLSRVLEIHINQKTLVTPTYFPAVSSYGTRFPFLNLVRFLIAYSYPRILVSAYDLYHLKKPEKRLLLEEIGGYWEKGGFVFLDSGVYESSWKANSEWRKSLYDSLMSNVNFDFYSSFDVLPLSEKSSKEFIKQTFTNILTSYNNLKRPGFVPIFHGLKPQDLVSLVSVFLKKYPNLCEIVAIPERDCGEDIITKVKTIQKVRRILNQSNKDIVLHVLGCGKPLSLLLFSYYGADMFDSLDWIKYTIDPSNLSINDFSYLELIDCDCGVCSKNGKNYTERVFLHNLLFYQNFMAQIRSLIRENEISDFLHRYLGKKTLRKLEF